MLQAAPSLSGVRTFEADVRDALFAGDKLSRGFRPEELPAINVTAMSDPVQSEPFTAGELRYLVPVSVVIVTRGQDKGSVRAAVRALSFEVEKLLHQARRSDNSIGPGAMVAGAVESSAAVIQDAPLHFGIGEVKAQIVEL
jgi:hypothetical protein